MAIDKKRKDELVGEYTDLLQRSSAIFLTRYGGMTVKEMEALRLKIGDVNGQINVTKNTLLGIALEQTDRVPPGELLNGQVATSFALGEASALAKVLVDQAKACLLYTSSPSLAWRRREPPPMWTISLRVVAPF